MARKESAMNSFCAWDGKTLVVNILGKPCAKKDAIGKTKGDQLKVSVTASPVAGKATDHMVRFLAKEFGVTVKDIEVVFGRFNVNKGKGGQVLQTSIMKSNRQKSANQALQPTAWNC